MTTAMICVALLGLLIFVLGFRVSMARRASKRGIGYDLDPTDPLHKAVRAHGNATEYAPMLAILILMVGAQGADGWMVVCMIGATLSRYLQAAGLLTAPTLQEPHPLRFVGSAGTYLFGTLLVVAGLVVAIRG